mmetsp:Transcript_6477/g.16033  ORF Transcript_6477/g.16033 Transcript_6477/m.16033 type:complete len:324 (+) Transcript_6477:337-1308(+)
MQPEAQHQGEAQAKDASDGGLPHSGLRSYQFLGHGCHTLGHSARGPLENEPSTLRHARDSACIELRHRHRHPIRQAILEKWQLLQRVKNRMSLQEHACRDSLAHLDVCGHQQLLQRQPRRTSGLLRRGRGRGGGAEIGLEGRRRDGEPAVLVLQRLVRHHIDSILQWRPHQQPASCRLEVAANGLYQVPNPQLGQHLRVGARLRPQLRGTCEAQNLIPGLLGLPCKKARGREEARLAEASDASSAAPALLQKHLVLRQERARGIAATEPGWRTPLSHSARGAAAQHGGRRRPHWSRIHGGVRSPPRSRGTGAECPLEIRQAAA